MIGHGRWGKSEADMTLAVARNDTVWRTFGRMSAEVDPECDTTRHDLRLCPRPGLDEEEHEVRGLLHLVQMISYCQRNCAATESERAQWLREAERANERLRRLRAAGWCPGLLR